MKTITSTQTEYVAEGSVFQIPTIFTKLQLRLVFLVAERWRITYGIPPEETDIDRWYDQFLPIQLECLEDYSQLISGTPEIVVEC